MKFSTKGEIFPGCRDYGPGYEAKSPKKGIPYFLSREAKNRVRSSNRDIYSIYFPSSDSRYFFPILADFNFCE